MPEAISLASTCVVYCSHFSVNSEYGPSLLPSNHPIRSRRQQLNTLSHPPCCPSHRSYPDHHSDLCLGSYLGSYRGSQDCTILQFYAHKCWTVGKNKQTKKNTVWYALTPAQTCCWLTFSLSFRNAGSFCAKLLSSQPATSLPCHMGLFCPRCGTCICLWSSVGFCQSISSGFPPNSCPTQISS